MTAAARNREDTAAWRAEVAAVNLARLRWLWIAAVGLMLLFAATIPWVRELHTAEFIGRTGLDVVITAAMFGGAVWAGRQPNDSPWRMRYVWCSAGALLLGLDTWYFEALPVFGNSSDYVLGVIVTGAVLLVPPRTFGAVLVANHAAFCVALCATPRPGTLVVAALIDASSAVALAWLVAWFLYRAREAEFHRARALAASNAELREVMAIAAHDMRSPLLGLRDLLGMARREPQVAGGLARMLDQAVETCAGMTRLLTRLVEAHAAEEADGQLQLVSRDLRAGCAAAAAAWAATAEAKGQRIAVALPGAPAPANVDATTLAQVLENLLGNALKFSPRDSRVELALAATADGAAWQIDVRDEGPGVPVEERAQLFQKFFRGSPRPTGGESSSGLGLFIVKTLTEAMGGRVSYAAREPRGSVFRIELPKERPAGRRSPA